MITLSIKKLERNLGKRIKKNVYCVGVDTASQTGVCFLTVSDKEAHFEWELFKLPTLPTKVKNQMEKAEKYELVLDGAVNSIRELKAKCKKSDNGTLILEQSFLLHNPETFGVLRALGGVFYTELYDFFPVIKFILPSEVRKIVGYTSPLAVRCPKEIKKTKYSQMKKECIVKWVNNVLGTEMTSNDLADATILALAGVIA